MSDMFMSYSRRNVEFVMQLRDMLLVNHPNQHDGQQYDIWLDVEDIEWSVDWWSRIQKGIAETNNFIALISTDYLASDVCHAELQYARENNKHIIPIIVERVDAGEFARKLDEREWKRGDKSLAQEQWDYLRKLNWINFDRMSFEQGVAALIEAISTDVSHKDFHTQLGARALQWQANQRQPSYLLNGEEIDFAENWLAQAVGKNPAPTQLHTEYIQASRARQRDRQRQLFVGVSVALIVSIALAILSFFLFRQADEQRQISDGRGTAIAFQVLTSTNAQGAAIDNAFTADANAEVANQNAATAESAQMTSDANADRAINNAATAESAQMTSDANADRAINNAATAESAQVTSDANALIANNNAATAVRAQTLNRVQAIAAASRNELDRNESRAILLALEALHEINDVWDAEVTLTTAMLDQLERKELIDLDVTQIQWNPALDSILLTGDFNQSVRVVDVQADTSELVSGPGERVATIIDWNPNGMSFLTNPATDTIGVIAPTDTGWMILNEFKIEGVISQAMWSPDGSKIAVLTDTNDLQVIDFESGNVIASIESERNPRETDMVWSPNSEWLAMLTSINEILVWDVATNSEVTRLSITGNHQITDMIWTQRGDDLIASDSNGTLHSWDVASGTLNYSDKKHVDVINGISLSPNGDVFVSYSDDSSIRVWDVRTGRQQNAMFGHDGEVTGLAWSPNGQRLVSISTDQTLRLWHINEQDSIILSTASSDLLAVDWSVEGNYIATVEADDQINVIKLWGTLDDLIARVESCCVNRQLTFEESERYTLPLPTNVPVPENLAQCPGTDLPSRIYPGAYAFVLEDDPRPLNVRITPSLSGRVVDQLLPSQTFYVIDGPRCRNDISWFQVAYGLDGETGWVAEALDFYFVAPVQQE